MGLQRHKRDFYLLTATCLCMALLSCGGGGSAPATIASSSDEIAAWGDSTTSGIGASTSELSYPAQLQAITGRSTFNGGVSGQTSAQISARQGGAPALVTFPNNVLPATGLVVLQSQSTFPVDQQGPGPITGTIGGIHGSLSYQLSSTSNPQLVFQRDTEGMSESIPALSPFIPDKYGRDKQVNVFWMGENNLYDPLGVESDIAKCIAILGSQHFIVMSLMNAGDAGKSTSTYVQLAQINAVLARAYPDNYLDIRKLLVDNYDPTKPQDVLDHDNDVPPDSLRNDNEHLNDKGYAFVAAKIAGFIVMKSW